MPWSEAEFGQYLIEKHGCLQDPSGQTDQSLDKFPHIRHVRLLWIGRRCFRPRKLQLKSINDADEFDDGPADRISVAIPDDRGREGRDSCDIRCGAEFSLARRGSF
jgi:hypothetical protein